MFSVVAGEHDLDDGSSRSTVGKGDQHGIRLDARESAVTYKTPRHNTAATAILTFQLRCTFHNMGMGSTAKRKSVIAATPNPFDGDQ